MTYEEIENRLLDAGGKVKRDFLRQKEGMIASIVTENAMKGILVSRREAFAIFKHKFMAKYEKENL